MWNKYLIFILNLIVQCKCYTNIPHKFTNSINNNKNNDDDGKNKIIETRKNLQKNIEIYESIKECDVTEIHTCGIECPLCGGEKVLVCNYCRGTGFLTMGDEIIGTGNNCTICMGKGEKECKRCMGSGYIARWRR